MSLLIRIIITSILSLFLLSCNFDINANAGRKGNGNVTTEERITAGTFTKIKAAQGLKVKLIQNNTTLVQVTADENLQELILTEIKNNVLHIHCKSQIGFANSKIVTVTVPSISSITASSGCNVVADSPINADKLHLSASSGSAIALDLSTNTLNCSTTSGSLLNVSGQSKTLNASASSGSALKAKALHTESAQVTASSGASLNVKATKALVAKASSGASIRYYGTPESVALEKNSGGGISSY